MEEKTTDLFKVTGLDRSLTFGEKPKNILLVVNVKLQPSHFVNLKNTHTVHLPLASLHSGFSRQLSRSSDLDRWRGAQSQLCLPLEMVLLIGRSSGAVNPQHLLASAGCGEDNKHYLEFLCVSQSYWKQFFCFFFLPLCAAIVVPTSQQTRHTSHMTHRSSANRSPAHYPDAKSWMKCNQTHTHIWLHHFCWLGTPRLRKKKKIV